MSTIDTSNFPKLPVCDMCGGEVLSWDDAARLARLMPGEPSLVQPRHIAPVIIDGQTHCPGSSDWFSDIKALVTQRPKHSLETPLVQRAYLAMLRHAKYARYAS